MYRFTNYCVQQKLKYICSSARFRDVKRFFRYSASRQEAEFTEFLEIKLCPLHIRVPSCSLPWGTTQIYLGFQPKTWCHLSRSVFAPSTPHCSSITDSRLNDSRCFWHISFPLTIFPFLDGQGRSKRMKNRGAKSPLHGGELKEPIYSLRFWAILWKDIVHPSTL